MSAQWRLLSTMAVAGLAKWRISSGGMAGSSASGYQSAGGETAHRNGGWRLCIGGMAGCGQQWL